MNNDTITLNGFDLSEVIDIIDIIRPVGNERHITTNALHFWESICKR